MITLIILEYIFTAIIIIEVVKAVMQMTVRILHQKLQLILQWMRSQQNLHHHQKNHLLTPRNPKTVIKTERQKKNLKQPPPQTVQQLVKTNQQAVSKKEKEMNYQA